MVDRSFFRAASSRAVDLSNDISHVAYQHALARRIPFSNRRVTFLSCVCKFAKDYLASHGDLQ
jgi:hypothetical protein